MKYNVTDWYWTVNEDFSQVWTSLQGKYVPLDDPLYILWVNGGGITTKIKSQEELIDVLKQQVPQCNIDGLLSLDQLKVSKITALYMAYADAVAEDVTITTEGGITQSFQSDPISQDHLVKALASCKATGIVPSDFYWVASDNSKVPFTLLDLQTLSTAMFNQAWTDFTHLQQQKTLVYAATTPAGVLAITW